MNVFDNDSEYNIVVNLYKKTVLEVTQRMCNQEPPMVSRLVDSGHLGSLLESFTNNTYPLS